HADELTRMICYFLRADDVARAPLAQTACRAYDVERLTGSARHGVCASATAAAPARRRHAGAVLPLTRPEAALQSRTRSLSARSPSASKHHDAAQHGLSSLTP